MTGGFLDGDVFRGLAFRILVFLTLALLPFGLIAVFQTREIARQANSNSELSLLALTDQAASAERSIFQEAFGAAEALSALTQLYASDARACSSFLSAYRRAVGLYSFISYLPPDGIVRCSSAGGSYDFSDAPGFARELENPRRQITANPSGEISAEPVLVLSQPFFTRAGFAGFITMSVPLSVFSAGMATPLDGMPAHLVTFNADGKIVRSDRTDDVTKVDLPADKSLQALVGQESVVFQSTNTIGEARIYAVVPVVPDVAYAMSIWRPDEMEESLQQSIGLSLALPVIMWLASLVVAFWSLNRLAVRHIKKLGRQMRHFAFNRRVPRTTLGQGVPRELAEIQNSFVRMADSIVRDEAALEDTLRDKNILLKEVHHRVKNNLQLISSIMNMQIRRAESDDARQVLKRLQERILSLATVHKNLYQTENLDRVDAGKLLEEIIGELLAMGLSASAGVRVTQHYASIQMDADDAAPLTLMVSEALTNALKYLGEPESGGPARLDITFEMSAENTACFRIANSTAGAQGSAGTGLGTQLISAFTRQLNGTVEVGYQQQEHWLEVRFPLRERVKGTYDF
ncbi:sensor histidine kinase [Roseobacter litoralis]|uniref:histidine kinase n=1 Tax=Roseobacter litoralis (strain ATCC 49566 / DSM 6996 / JCM 21268 / NBRC 15278 / OCh 149) TaxID=391595 RepID=F7ZM48_ROSLO|nr:sensor histidine kinase [Roseobacter litoralis]AEI96385.1 putative histidine kinase [Roseobacter litoralis Och 149]